MNETNNTITTSEAQTTQSTVLATPPVEFSLSLSDILTNLQSFNSQADTTLNQLQANIDSANNQIKEWQRMQLLITGQKQMALDLSNKMVKPTTTTVKQSENK